jgi:hypothetical protein
MSFIRRLYQPLIENHFRKNRQMFFLMGPRQVGKTTLCLHLKNIDKGDFFYMNWDNTDDREVLLKGPKAIATYLNLDKARKTPPIVIFDEIHKYRDWKLLLKGFFDTYSHSGEVRIVVTGSARLDIFKFGGDSLMGRYFRCRIHPFSVAELIRDVAPEGEISLPSFLSQKKFQDLYTYGGFPEPFTQADPNFYQQWKQLKLQQLFYEDIRDLTRVQEIRQIELLAIHLQRQVGSLTNYTNLANKIRVSVETIRRWVETLHQLYYSFQIAPWSKNVTRSLLKEPKIYLWDWSLVEDEGARVENFIASQLLKACHYWIDKGLGQYDLYFLRDKEKREVDFLVTKNNQPWFLVEAKRSQGPISPYLKIFQDQTNAKHAFQIILNAEYEDINCFSFDKPAIFPAITFLSQLV